MLYLVINPFPVCFVMSHIHFLHLLHRPNISFLSRFFSTWIRRGTGLMLLLLLSPWTVSISFAQTAYVQNIVVVQFNPDIAYKTDLPEFNDKALGYQVHKIERVYPFLDHVEPTPKTRQNLMALRRTYYVHYHADASPKQVATDLLQLPGVTYSEPLIRAHVHQLITPNDPEYGTQTEIQTLKLPEAWDIVRGEQGEPETVVAVVDTGTEWQHEDLIDNVWTNEDEIPGNGIDDDNNGFIDDVHGANFLSEDPTYNDPAPMSAAVHGTHTSGIVGAVTDNGIGIAGAAWNAEIMYINAACPNSTIDLCYGFEGIMYAAANGADIINASWNIQKFFVEPATFYDQSLELATDMGALVVSSAGNQAISLDLFRSYPASHPRVLSVGATEKETRRRAHFSNYGRMVDVFAPGESIRTTGTQNTYEFIEGTSFATPLVSGIAALVKTKHPDWTPDRIREHIRLTSENMDVENPSYTGELGRGFVNALTAVQKNDLFLPSLRIKRWTWVDDDENHEIFPGDEVTIETVLTNHLSDANQLQVELVPADSYPFLDWITREKEVGELVSKDSVRLEFSFRLAQDSPSNQIVRLFLQIHEGDFTDQTGMILIQIYPQFEEIQNILNTFYTATGGDSWTVRQNWDFTKVPTEKELALWFGVGFIEGWIAGLTLNRNNLVGELPPELGNLSTLWNLSLNGNALFGTIPPELGHLANLETLQLSRNQFAGEIPSELGNLAKLKRLSLSKNSLSGNIPEELGNLSELARMWLFENSLSGNIPEELGNLSELESLQLSSNLLSGKIPTKLANLAQLQELTLNNNQLSEEIPAEFGKLTELKRLYLDDNRLTGTIPPEIGSLPNLLDLLMQNNKLTGTIPTELGNLTRLNRLSIQHNSLSGEIPPELGDLAHLEILNLDHNSLTGTIPTELGNLTSLKRFAAQHNSLSGEIPPEFGNLSNLEDLFLNNNSLTGTIPPELGNLSQLRDLILNVNSLSGEIPPELGNLASLTRLALVDNSLSGNVPPELGNLGNLERLLLDGNSLTGSLPRSLMKLNSLRRLSFGGQTLCAPANDEFQAWLRTIALVEGPTCADISFTGQIADQSYTQGRPIAALVLSEAATGTAPITYSLSPSLPQGLHFNPTTRTISGTPTEIISTTTFTYKARDADGNEGRIIFRIEVNAPVTAEYEVLPEEFALHPSYPNPFRYTTHVVFDLPWPANLEFSLMDILGRRVYTQPMLHLEAGWNHRIELSGISVPSGPYLYQLTAISAQGRSVRTGSLIRIR